MSGLFIALEGTEGSGKTTIAERLAGAFREQGRAVTVTREPGGTAIGERIRDVLLSGESSDMAAETEALLFAAARAEHVARVIRPALGRGGVVITDRFTDSSLAYQWGGRGLPFEAVVAAQRLAAGDLEPDLKLLLDLPVDEGLRRRFADRSAANRLDRETAAFHERVRAAYHTLAASDSERWRVIDASRSQADVWADVWDAVAALDTAAARVSPDVRPERHRWST